MTFGALNAWLAPKGSFRAHMLVRMSGTAVAQLIILAVSPLLTRLFGPESFGILGVFASLAFVSASISTLQFDQALMLPGDDEESAALLWAALLSTAAVGGIVLLACLAFSLTGSPLLGIQAIAGWSLILPAAVLAQGLQAAFTSWSVRRKRFARAAAIQVARATTLSGMQLAAGLARSGPAGLIHGWLAGDALAAVAAGGLIPGEDRRFLRRAWNWGRIRQAAWRYRDFPLFSSACALLNAMSKFAPVFLLAGFFGPAVAGFYDVSVRVIQAPMNFVLTSLRQVLFQRANEVFRQGGDTRRLFRRTTAALLAIAALPALAVLLFGPRLFAFALGAGWQTAGVYASWMVLWLLFGFAAAPAVLFIQVYRKQKPLLFQNAALLLLRVLAIWVGSRLGSPLLAVALCSLVGVLYNLALILWADRFLRVMPRGSPPGPADS